MFGLFYGYGLYLIIGLPALILGLWAQAKVQGAFSKYSQVRNMSQMTGAQVARRMLDSNGLSDVRIEQTTGILSDNYDPRSKVLRLSPQVFQGPTVAAAGVAAHEAGHALQHAEGYAMLRLRTAMVPSVQIGSWLGPILFFIGLLFSQVFGDTLALVGLILFALTAVFALVTLPVEYNASHRAKAWLTESGIIYGNEAAGINSVLDAAALTYVAAAIQALSTVFYYATILLLGRSRN